MGTTGCFGQARKSQIDWGLGFLLVVVFDCLVVFLRRTRRHYENYNQSAPYRSSSHLRIPVRFFLLNYVKTKLKSYFSQRLILLLVVFIVYSWSPSLEHHMSHRNVSLDLLFFFILTAVYLESCFTYSVDLWTNVP